MSRKQLHIIVVMLVVFLLSGCADEEKVVTPIKLPEENQERKTSRFEFNVDERAEMYFGCTCVDNQFEVLMMSYGETTSIKRSQLVDGNWKEKTVELSSEVEELLAVKQGGDGIKAFPVRSCFDGSQTMYVLCSNFENKPINEEEATTVYTGYFVVSIDLVKSEATLLWSEKFKEKKRGLGMSDISYMENGNLLLYDNSQNSVYEYDVLGQRISTQPLEMAGRNFLQFDNEKIWLEDSQNKQLIRYDWQDVSKPEEYISHWQESGNCKVFGNEKEKYLLTSDGVKRIVDSGLEEVKTDIEFEHTVMTGIMSDVSEDIYVVSVDTDNQERYYVYMMQE